MYAVFVQENIKWNGQETIIKNYAGRDMNKMTNELAELWEDAVKGTKETIKDDSKFYGHKLKCVEKKLYKMVREGRKL